MAEVLAESDSTRAMEAHPAASSGADSRVLTIPNIISFVRLATVPVFVWLFVAGYENAAVVVYAAAAWSDFFDGYIARRTNSVTELGKLLDPLADRIFIAALVIALVVRRTLPWWVGMIVLGRDLLVLSLFPYLERRKIERISVNAAGKAATASLLLGLTTLAWSHTTFPGSGIAVEPGLALTWLGAALYWVAGLLYGREALQKLRQLGRARV